MATFDYPDRPVVQPVGRFRVVRDDLVPGGTKERALRVWLPSVPGDVFVYATPAQGYAQVAVARVCRALGKRAVLFVAGRRTEHPRTAAARAAGAEIRPVTDCFMLNVVQARAREHARETGATLLPFGLGCDGFDDALADVIRSSGETPWEAWCAAGSGTLSRAMQRAWPRAKIRAVCVGTKKVRTGDAKQFWYDLPFDKPARRPPPFPSVLEYDAKAWEMMQGYGNDDALFWNVAADSFLTGDGPPADTDEVFPAMHSTAEIPPPRATPPLNALTAAFDRAFRLPAVKKLLNPKWREVNARPGCPHSRGFCYIASEAAYHLLGGKPSGWKPHRAAWAGDDGEEDHWWLSGPAGVYDPTVSQFTERGLDPPYHLGKPRSFMTPEPSKRAAELTDAVKRFLPEYDRD